MFNRYQPYLYGPGWVGGNGDGGRSPLRAATRAAVDQMQAFRGGAGPNIGLHLDTNFNFRAEGFLRMARALEPLDLEWLEVDSFDVTAIADLRRGTTTPIASCETLTGLRQLRPFLEGRACDVAIIDVMYNGILEALRMASLCDAFEINVATHNYSGPIGSIITAAYCGILPNFRVMEFDVDQVPWAYDLSSVRPIIENSHISLLSGPDRGTEVNEEAVKAHPPVQENSGLV